MEFPVDFFRDEVRMGFYVPTTVKQAWAEELTIVSEIDRICKKHNIRYFANYGTFLGTLRHGGFVPWDDDLDLCMLREDYVRFREVADAELPEQYRIHDYERQKDHWFFIVRVVNREHISFAPEDLNKNHNYPWLAGVDIFIKDNLYEDAAQERARDDEVLHILAVADGIIDGSLDAASKEIWLQQFEKQYGISLDRNLDTRHMGITLYRLAEQQMARVPAAETDIIQQIFPGVLKDWTGHPRSYYARRIRLPFENTNIPAVAGYDKVLHYIYGNYQEIRKVADWHPYPYFEAQKEELGALADFDLPEYRFDRKAMTGRDKQAWEKPHRKKVVFLAAGPMWWQAFASWYQKETEDAEADVRVVALPMLFKDCYGEIKATDQELAEAAREEEYPEGLAMVPWYDFDIEQELPDKVYIQDAYDGENPCLTIPQVLYASHIREYTKELVLVPALVADFYSPENKKDQYALRYYVTVPGVVYADRVMLVSEELRERYLAALLAWAGEDTRTYWEEKLEVHPAEKVPDELEERKERILFVIGANELEERGDSAEECIREKLARAQEAAEQYEVNLSIYPPDLSAWEETFGERVQTVEAMINEALEKGMFGFCDMRENTYEELAEYHDVYYGSASPSVSLFLWAGKTVVPMDADIITRQA